MLTIYHNPRCSKSRQTLALIEASGMPVDVVAYLKDTPSPEKIQQLLTELGFTSARQLMRTKEEIYKHLSLKDEHDEAALIRAMHQHPKLIERPIVSNGTLAILGRPPENVQKLL